MREKHFLKRFAEKKITHHRHLADNSDTDLYPLEQRGSPKSIITLTMTDGKIYTLTRAGKVDFKRETMIHLPDGTGEIIDTLTTTNELINKILRVDLTFPERRGFENFCLIDTPGINPGGEESKEHILQTQKVLREDADAVIVLYSAKDAMTRGHFWVWACPGTLGGSESYVSIRHGESTWVEEYCHPICFGYWI